jgi:vancomycin resistance protein YoaR
LAGFPIVDRTPHAYRVGYYEQTATGAHNPNLAGLDATVFFPLVDLKFTNDTPYWLLMETYFSASNHSLTWKFYSTSDGRTVDWNTTGPVNLVDPPAPVYTENSDLPKGTINQVEWAVQGADVTVNRTVSRGGSVYLQDTFKTHYVPWADAYEYGPGTDIPSSSSK